jgi:hypothetical protein
MDNFKRLHAIFDGLNNMENELKSLRDNVSLETKQAINGALACISPVRDALWKVDGALAKGKGV